MMGGCSSLYESSCMEVFCVLYVDSVYCVFYDVCGWCVFGVLGV